MTTPTRKTGPDAGDASGVELPEALRWQLRALRRDDVPSHELWPGIAARLRPPSAATPRWPRWIAPLAVAATLVIAVGVTGLWRDGLPSSVDEVPVTVVQREAAGLARQYDAALSEVAIAQAAPAPALQSTLDELDRSLSFIHHALTRDPDSRLLLDQLRRTYAHRLALAQRAAYG